jgi:Flp pilus assembly pilin Flp
LLLHSKDFPVTFSFAHFLADENGAITVDYTVLSAAAVGMAIAATAVLTGGIEAITSRIDEELRARQLNDSFIAFTAAHFEPILAENVITEAEAQALWEAANTLMNNEILTALQEGIAKIENGTITMEEASELFAVASVAYQRNIVDDAVLNYYFGFDGSGGFNPPAEFGG